MLSIVTLLLINEVVVVIWFPTKSFWPSSLSAIVNLG